MSTAHQSILLPSPAAVGREDSLGGDLQHVVSRVRAILGHRRWLFVFPLLTGILGSLTVSLFLPRKYVLDAMFERRDDAVITNLVAHNSPYSFETLRRSLNIDLAGYNAIAEAADQLGLTADLPKDASGELTAEGRAAKQALVGMLGRQTDVTLMEKSTFLDLIDVKYTGDNPDLGVKVVTKLKDNYMVRTRQRITDILSKSHGFFSQESNKRREAATKLESELLQTALLHPGVDDPGVLDNRLVSATMALKDLALRRQEAQSKLNGLLDYLRQLEGGPSSRPAAMPANMKSNPRRLRLQTEMDNVLVEIANAKSLKKMTDLHPSVMALRAKLEQLRAEAEKEPEIVPLEPAGAVGTGESPTNMMDAEHRRVQSEAKAFTESLAQLDEEIARRQKEKAYLEDEKGKLFERRETFLAKQQELASAKNELRVWEGHVDSIDRVLAAEAEARGIQFATVDDARRPAKPISPTVPGVLLISAAIGLALAVGMVFIRELFDRSLRTPQSVRDLLGLPVLETIGEIRTGPRSGWARLSRVLPVLAGLEGAAVLGLAALVYCSLEMPGTYARIAAHAASVLHG
jgi:uncharacterized protein involved in exopolysaccharide biosynthesis